jgi:molybdate transport system regulatory protein
MGRRLNQATGDEQAVLSLRIDFAGGKRLGPGKVRLLEAIAEHGSISAGGRSLDMSYKRAWELVDELNGIFGAPVVAPKTGGQKGGGATLTALGEEIVQRYRTIEQNAKASAETELSALRKAVKRK